MEDNTSVLTLEQWPFEASKVPQAYDREFARFESIVKVGKRKFVGGYLRNSAKNKLALLEHARLLVPKFNSFIEGFTSQQSGGVFATSGVDNVNLVKTDDGLDFKLKYKNADQIRDVVRTSIVCPSITSLERTILSFIDYCKSSGLDYCNCNFYDNVKKFGAVDRVDVNHPFGYVGVHFDIAFVIDDVEVSSTSAAEQCADLPSAPADPATAAADAVNIPTGPTILMAEVQFHPSTIYDGTPNCLKERQHAACRAFHMKIAQKDPEAAAKARSVIEMHYAYAMATTPL